VQNALKEAGGAAERALGGNRSGPGERPTGQGEPPRGCSSLADLEGHVVVSYLPTEEHVINLGRGSRVSLALRCEASWPCNPLLDSMRLRMWRIAPEVTIEGHK